MKMMGVCWNNVLVSGPNPNPLYFSGDCAKVVGDLLLGTLVALFFLF